MTFERPSISTIKDRIEKGIEVRLTGKVALLRNAVLRILARVFAGAIHGAYGYVFWLSRQLFVTTAETEFLNRHGLMWGVERRPGSFASGDVIFTGTDGTVIPVDSRVQNEDGIEYGTTIIATITGGVATTSVQAIESGLDANFERPNPPDSIYLQMISPITGIDDEIEIDGDITGGEDVEDDETYRARIFQRIQTIPAGGSEVDYIRWATEVAGVARAWCYPVEDGPGTVVTVITASGNNPVPSSILLADVDSYMTDRKPVTATHRAASIQDADNVDGKAIVTMGVRVTPISAEIQSNIETNLQQLFLPHKPGTDVPISQIRAAISNTGVTDYVIDWIYLDSYPRSVADLDLNGFQYPWLGTMTFSELI